MRTPMARHAGAASVIAAPPKVRRMTFPMSSAGDRLQGLIRASSALAALPAGSGPADVLAALYREVALLYGISNFIISLYDRDQATLHCGFAMVEGAPYPIERFPPLPLGSGPTSQVVRAGRPLIISDVQREGGNWNIRRIGDGPAPRSIVLAPMMRGGDVVGVVQAQSYQPDAFSNEDAAMLAILANQAAAAHEAVRQRDEARAAARRAHLLDSASRRLGDTLDLKEVLAALAAEVGRELGAGCMVLLLNPTADAYEARAVSHRDTALRPLMAALERRPFDPLQTSVIGATVLRGKPLFVDDLSAVQLPETLRLAVHTFGLRGALVTPITRRGAVLGVVVILGTEAYPLREDDRQLADALADRAAAAIDHGRLHEEMTVQRQFLEQLIETEPVGIAVVRGGRPKYEVANAAYRRWLGIDDIIGQDFESVNRTINPRLAERGQRMAERVLRGGRPARMKDLQLSAGAEPRYASIVLQPLPPRGGVTDGFLMLVWDTTDAVLARRRLSQLALQSAEHAAGVEAVIANMAEGVLVAAADGTVQLLNEAGRAILGRPLPDTPIRVWQFMDLLQIEPTAGSLTPFSAAALWQVDRPMTGNEAMIRRPDGAARTIRWSVAPLPGPGDGWSGTVTSFEDITDRRALEHAREEFLAQASHELRTPLTSVLAYLQLVDRRVQRDPTMAPAMVEAVSGALAQAQRLRELVTDLLDASRIRQGRLELRREPVELAMLLRDLVARQRASESGELHVFRFNAPPEPVVGHWDSGRIRQVFVNLLSNAVKYSPSGGLVTVTISATAGEAVVVVQDQGIGIAADELPKLFRPFARSENIAARNISGFGLGLYICRDIVERHGGTIAVASAAGRGTAFTVRLPRLAPSVREAG